MHQSGRTDREPDEHATEQSDWTEDDAAKLPRQNDSGTQTQHSDNTVQSDKSTKTERHELSDKRTKGTSTGAVQNVKRRCANAHLRSTDTETEQRDRVRQN